MIAAVSQMVQGGEGGGGGGAVQGVLCRGCAVQGVLCRGCWSSVAVENWVLIGEGACYPKEISPQSLTSTMLTLPRILKSIFVTYNSQTTKASYLDLLKQYKSEIFLNSTILAKINVV